MNEWKRLTLSGKFWRKPCLYFSFLSLLTFWLVNMVDTRLWNVCHLPCIVALAVTTAWPWCDLALPNAVQQ